MLVIFVSLVVVGLSQSPPFWGGNPRFTTKVQMTTNTTQWSWNFTYFYDWSLKAERYQHQSRQRAEMCSLPETSFSIDGIPCVITYATDGWSYISFPTQNFCCKCSNKFGAIRYDWLQQDSTYQGIQTIDGRSVTHWIKNGFYGPNHYYATVDKQLPVRFFEIMKGFPKHLDFDLDTYSTGPIDPSKFAPQCSTQCIGQCSTLSSQEENLQIE